MQLNAKAEQFMAISLKFMEHSSSAFLSSQGDMNAAYSNVLAHKSKKQ